MRQPGPNRKKTADSRQVQDLDEMKAWTGLQLGPRTGALPTPLANH